MPDLGVVCPPSHFGRGGSRQGPQPGNVSLPWWFLLNLVESFPAHSIGSIRRLSTASVMWNWFTLWSLHGLITVSLFFSASMTSTSQAAKWFKILQQEWSHAPRTMISLFSLIYSTGFQSRHVLDSRFSCLFTNSCRKWSLRSSLLSDLPPCWTRACVGGSANSPK